MTDAFDPTPVSPNRLPDAGVLPDQEGAILQRGGEELAIEKVGDRFTVRPVAGRSLTALVQALGAEAYPVPSLDLVVLQVRADQLEQAMAIARDSDAVEFASHVYQLHDSPETYVYLTDELTVQFADNTGLETIRAIVREAGLKAVQPVVGVPQTYVFQVTQQSGMNAIKLANRLMRRSDVLTAEPNVVIREQKLYRPRDPEYARQWYLYNTGGAQVDPTAHVSVEPAWDVTRGIRSVVVAITDDGFDLNHPDFQGKGKVVAPQDFKNQDALPLPEASQENHGTACAGVAIAEENNTGIVGVAPGCAFMPVRTTGFLDDRAIEALFAWVVDKGAAVVSCSWGPSAVYFSLSLRQRAALTRAATQGRGGKGCVIVFAAGNANRPVSGTVNEQSWPRDVLKGPTNWLNGFAVHPDVIAVSACTSLGKKAAYSNWGDAISVCAPSNNAPPGVWLPQTGYIYTAPAVQGALPGQGVFTSDRLGAAGYSPNAFADNFGGTSSACPVVAGVAALVLSVNPFLKAQEVKQILQETADKIMDTNPDPQLGNRKGVYTANGHSPWFGYGKVNAGRAVQVARSRLPVAIAPSRWVQGQNSTPMAIPDFNAQGATSLIRITDVQPVQDIRITVEVEHEFMGDLELYLVPPQGNLVMLQSRTLGRLTRLQTTYTLQTTPLLRDLLGQSARGNWQLRLIDGAPLHTGQLKSWLLNLGV